MRRGDNLSTIARRYGVTVNELRRANGLASSRIRAGDNEVAVVISDSFGGWGIMGRFADASGLTISAR